MNNLKKGFTLLELLVVISIIGVLSTVVMASINSARINAIDAYRLSIVKQLQTALEIYYLDHGYYPQMAVHTWNGGYNKDTFETEIAPYMSVDLDELEIGPYWAPGDGVFYYDSNLGNNYQTYGIRIRFESSSNSDLEQNDGGGSSSYYELGVDPKYCKDKYDGGWYSYSYDTVCYNGN